MATAPDPASRFEYRTWFAPESAPHVLFDDWDEETPDGPEERTDVYLLPVARPWLLPKIRDGDRFEVKRLLDLAADGLERGELMGSAAFPLDPDAVALAAGALGSPRWSEMPDGRSAGRLCAWAEAAKPAVIAVEVRKRRQRFRRGALSGEWTLVEIVPLAQTVVTIAIEGERADRVRAFLEESGLRAVPNLGYGAFLAYLAETGVPPVSRTPSHLLPDLA